VRGTHQHGKDKVQLVQDPHFRGARRAECRKALHARPYKQRDLCGEVEDEEAVVVLADAVADPGAVVVEAADTVATVVTVFGSQWLPELAVGAVAARVV
jgi:hypothetical protein